VLERQLQEPALVGVELAVEALVDGGLGGVERQHIAGESLRRVAVDVAGELVEQEHQCERAVRAGPPGVELAGENGGDGRSEAFADRGVKCRVLAEPGVARRVWWLAESESENVGGGE